MDNFTVKLIHSLVGTVTFNQTTYNVSEKSTAQIVLILSNPSSSEVTVEVFNTNKTAFGKAHADVISYF